MKPNRQGKKHRISIRQAVILFILIFIVLILTPVFYIQLQNVERVGEEEAHEQIGMETEHVVAHVKEILRHSENINQITAGEIKAGVVSHETPDELQRLFLYLVKGYTEVSSMYFGNTRGGLADAGFEPTDGSYYFIETEDFLPGTFYKYVPGNPEETLDVVEDFDARTRPWYQNALTQDGVVWNDVYVLFTGQDMALSSSLAVYDEDEHLLGVVGNDIFLAQLSDFLAERAARYGHLIFVMERSGLLIASSDQSPLFLQEGETYKRIGAVQSSSPLIAAAANALEEDLASINGASRLSFSLQEQRYYLDVRALTPTERLDWLVVVVAPRTDFLAGIRAHRRVVLFSYSVFLLFLFVLSFLGHRWLVKPIVHLTDAVRKVGDFTRTEKNLPNTSRLVEVSQLTASFNRMHAQIKTSLVDLKNEMEEHKAVKEALAVSEARYRAVVEDVPGFVTAFLPDGEITFVNQQYANYYQKTVEELLGVNFLALIPHEEGEKVMRELQSLTPANPVGVLTQFVIAPEGEKRYQRWVNRALFNEQGEVVSYLSFGEDIEDEYKAQLYRQALLEITQAANTSLNLHGFYHALYQIVQKLIETSNFYIALENDENNRLEIVYVEDEFDSRTIPVTKNGLSEYVWRRGEALLADAATLLTLKEEEGVQLIGEIPAVWLGVPLMRDGKALGVIAVQDYNDAWIGEDEKELLEIISSSIANIISRKQAEAETRELAQTNAWLYLAGQAMSQTLDLDSLYEKIYTLVSGAMPCDTFILSSYDAQESTILCEFVVNEKKKEDPADFPPIPLSPEGKGIQSRVIRSGAPLLISDLLEAVENTETSYIIDEEGEVLDAKELPTQEEVARTRSGIFVPLKLGSDVIGVLQVQSYKKAAYTVKNLNFLKALSSQISFSINNASLLEERQAEIERRRKVEKELRELTQQLEARVHKRTAELDRRVKLMEHLNEGMKNMMTDLNLANKVASQKTRDLQESNRELQAFTYSVSHDLRAPLRHIESFSQFLQEKDNDKLDERSQRYLENIIAATARMRSLIEDILALFRTGRAELHIRPIELNPIIESVRAQQFAEVDGRDIVWKIATLPPTRADAGLMKILWENLIGNALKYTRPREKAVIEIGSELSENGRIFFIRDNGTGFPNEYRDKMFNAFERLHSNEEFEGSGIGLAIVRRVIERHQGKIWAESEEGKGATFYFTLDPKDQSDQQTT